MAEKTTNGCVCSCHSPLRFKKQNHCQQKWLHRYLWITRVICFCSLVLTVVKHSYPINLQSNMGPVVCPICLLKCYSPKCSYWPYVLGKLAFQLSQQIKSSCTLPTKSPFLLPYVLEIPSPFSSIYLHATKENVFMDRNI